MLDVTTTWVQDIQPYFLATYIPVVAEGRSKEQSLVFPSDVYMNLDKYAYEKDVNNLHAVKA